MNASIQIKTHSVSSARNKNTHILRNSEAYENPRIIVLVQNDLRNFQKPEKAKPTKAVMKNEAERKKELKKVNSAIAVYTKRIEAINPEDEEKRKRIQKLEEKRRELLKKREELKEAKEVEETRGKKQEHHYVEFVFSITRSNEYREDDEFVEVFEEAQTHFLENNVFKGLKMETNAIHLDQFSVHSHALFKLPEGTTWKKHLSQFNGTDGREIYKQISKAWHKTVEKELKANFGIEIEEMHSGKRYKSLKTFKKENPVQILEKVEKINSEPILSDISPNIRDLYKRAKAHHELVNFLFKKEKSTQPESSSNQQVSEAQPSSNTESSKPQNRAKR